MGRWLQPRAAPTASLARSSDPSSCESPTSGRDLPGETKSPSGRPAPEETADAEKQLPEPRLRARRHGKGPSSGNEAPESCARLARRVAPDCGAKFLSPPNEAPPRSPANTRTR